MGLNAIGNRLCCCRITHGRLGDGSGWRPLFLLSGAIFPIDVLPRVSQALPGFALPITYWLELLRRSLVGGHCRRITTFSRLERAGLAGASSLGLTLAAGHHIALIIFRFCDFWARERGLIDRTTILS